MIEVGQAGVSNSEPARANSPFEKAQLIKRVQPIYPRLARQARIQGTVRLSATIGTDGMLHNIWVISGHALLSDAAIAAVKQWRYIPTRVNENLVDANTTIEVNFILGQ